MPQKLLYFILHRLNMTNTSYTDNLFCLIFLLNKYFIDELKTEKNQKNWAWDHLYPKPDNSRRQEGKEN